MKELTEDKAAPAAELRTTPGLQPSTATAAGALLAVLLYWVVHRSLIDDAFITLSYARNLASHLHWGLIEEETANSATSPLNVLVLGAAHFVFRNGTWAVGAVYVGSNAIYSWYIARTSRSLALPTWATILAIALPVLNPFILSSVGMEVTTLGLALLAALTYYSVKGEPVPFGIAAGLALLTRLDLVVFVVALGLSSRTIRRRAVAAFAAALVVSVPWFIFSWLQLGSALPDTLLIKTSQDRDYTFRAGPFFYAERVPVAVIISFAPVVISVAVVLLWWMLRLRGHRWARSALQPVAALGLAGFAHYAAYSVLKVFPYVWYYGPTIIAASMALALLAPSFLSSASTAVRRVPRRVGFCVLAGLALAQAVVVIEHEPLSWREPAIIGNIAPSSDYRRIGAELGLVVREGTVGAPPEIGALAYACDCAIVDVFSDPGQVLPLIEDSIGDAPPVVRQALALNYANRARDVLPRVPDYYLLHLPGPPEGAPAWDLQSEVAGETHLVLEENPAHPDVIANLLRRVLDRLPPDGEPVILQSRGEVIAGREIVAMSYQLELARLLRDRGVAVQLHSRQRSGQVFIVAAGSSIDEALREPDVGVVAYGGSVSWAQRLELKRREAQVVEQHEKGEISDLERLEQVVALRGQMGTDVAVLSTGG